MIKQGSTILAGSPDLGPSRWNRWALGSPKTPSLGVDTPHFCPPNQDRHDKTYEAVLSMADWARGGFQDLSALSCDPTQLPKLPEMAPEETTSPILYLMLCPSSDFSLSNYMMLAFSHQFPRILRLCFLPFSPCVLSINSHGCQCQSRFFVSFFDDHSFCVSFDV